jgi:hypothetical protein
MQSPVSLRLHALVIAGFALSISSAGAQSGSAVSSADRAPLLVGESNDATLRVEALPGDAAWPKTPDPGSPAAGQEHGGEGHHGSHGNRVPLNRLVFEAGGGFNAPTSDSSPYITWGGNFTVGAGLHFTSMLSALVEYQFIDSKVPGRLIAEAGADGGYDHIWSFTIAPVINLFPKGSSDIYLTGGGGFYRKVTSFTDILPSQFCTYFYCGIGYSPQVVGHFSSNQGGWNIGGGFEHRLGGLYGEGRMRVFAEARYLDVLSPAITTQPNGLGTTTVGADTRIVPVTFGIRF